MCPCLGYAFGSGFDPHHAGQLALRLVCFDSLRGTVGLVIGFGLEHRIGSMSASSDGALYSSVLIA